MRILFEDNHLLVADKAPNVLSQQDDSGDPDMLTLLKQYLKEKYNKPGNVYLGLVHRLDRPVGGVMVFAKTSKAASRLSDQVRTRTLHKTYRAVVRGVPSPTAGRLVHHLHKDQETNTVSVVPPSHPQGKEAVLDYTVLASLDGLALLEIRLHTGRPHQIRVQLATIGCPIVGDQRYGAAASGKGKPTEAIALRAVRLALLHPVSKELLTFAAPPPEVDWPWSLWPQQLGPQDGSADIQL